MGLHHLQQYGDPCRTLVGRSPPNGMMGPAQLKSLGPYLARHLIWTAMTPPKDDPIGSHAHIVALELWSVRLRRLSRMGR